MRRLALLALLALLSCDDDQTPADAGRDASADLGRTDLGRPADLARRHDMAEVTPAQIAKLLVPDLPLRTQVPERDDDPCPEDYWQALTRLEKLLLPKTRSGELQGIIRDGRACRLVVNIPDEDGKGFFTVYVE